MNLADKLVNEALFGVPEIEHEPQNYFVHRDTFLKTVERAIELERERCCQVLLGGRFLHDGSPEKQFAEQAVAAMRRQS